MPAKVSENIRATVTAGLAKRWPMTTARASLSIR